MVPTPPSTLVPTFPRNNLGNVVLGLVWSGDCTKESVWILQTYCSRFTLGFGYLVCLGG